ncbi:integrator complex subunit 12-like [Planococcus citri]|uniref:integrator complex subunit 12-like n=1 Tax=Planococcus citri TaxID=170843 RepID=UPI0031F7BCB4
MSSDKRKEVNEKHDTPDSTTKERLGFYEGDDILVSQADGTFHLGTVAEICASSKKCLVKFGDGTESWSHFRDLTPLNIPDTEECSVVCVTCKRSQTKKNNAIVVCKKCDRGYHQECYKPVIQSAKKDWKCKRCNRSNKNCQPVTKKTVIKDLPYDATTNNSSNSDRHLADLPPTPPSSVSDPETPQLSIVNGEPPTSPVEDRCCDFNETSTPNQTTASGIAASAETSTSGPCLNLDDLLSSRTTRANGRSSISLPLQLNAVITDPVIRPTKRRLSEKDIRVKTNGEIRVKRRRINRLNSLGNLRPSVDKALAAALAAAAAARPSTSASACSTPVKIVPNGSTSADLKSVVYGYYNDETKSDAETKLDKVKAGEEFRICGKRQTIDGKVEYLIDWIKCTKPL